MEGNWAKIGLYISIAVTGLLVLGFVAESVGLLGGGEGAVSNEPIWLLDTATGESWSVSQKEFTEMMQQQGGDPMMMMAGPGQMAFNNPKTGKKTVVIAEKCAKCGAVFVPNYTQDYPDRCPKCKSSRLEELSKESK